MLGTPEASFRFFPSSIRVREQRTPGKPRTPCPDLPRCHTPWLGRLDLVPELCRPPPIAGGFRHRKSQCRRISCPLRFAAPRRMFLTNFRGQRPSGERGTSSTTVRRSTPAVPVAVAARKGRPIAVRPHQRLRCSTPHPPITSPSPETRRRAATTTANRRRCFPLYTVSTRAQEVFSQ